MSTLTEVRLVPATGSPAPDPPDRAPTATEPETSRRAPARPCPAPPDPGRPPTGAAPAPVERARGGGRRRSRCTPTVEPLGGALVPAYQHDPAPTEPGGPVAAHWPGPWSRAPGATVDPRQACCMLALAAVEVLAGTRPLAQLSRWVAPEVYDDLAQRTALTAAGRPALDTHVAGFLPARRGSAVRTPAPRPSIRRVRATRVHPDAMECTVVVGTTDRVRAVAVRMSRTHGRWRASALVVG